MAAIPETFRAFVAEQTADGRVERGIREDFAAADLPDGDVEVRVDWSSVNYKDGLATTARRQGRPDQPDHPRHRPRRRGRRQRDADARRSATPVLAHGYDLGVARHGGYGQFARVPAG